jgi:hypothetical protein
VKAPTIPSPKRTIAEENKPQAEIKLFVNRFVGFGLAGLINNLRNKVQVQYSDENCDNEDAVRSRRQLKFARKMRTLHADALILPEYLNECYDKCQALNNHGYLALVSPQCFRVGEKLMTIVCRYIHADIFRQDGNECLRKAKEKFEAELPVLMDVFHSCHTFGSNASDLGFEAGHNELTNEIERTQWMSWKTMVLFRTMR